MFPQKAGGQNLGLRIVEDRMDRVAKQGPVFTERALSEILKQTIEDEVRVRRYLGDFGYLSRDPSGKEYRMNPNRK